MLLASVFFFCLKVVEIDQFRNNILTVSNYTRLKVCLLINRGKTIYNFSYNIKIDISTF
nr:MAG TPA: hypothetical protein [Caudoviricetes sp.]